MGQLITVEFQTDTLFAVEREDGVFIAVKPICDSLGLTWQGQLQRIKEDPVLSEGVTMVVIPSPGGAQETTCLRLDLVNGWLFKIDSRRVRDEDSRQKLLTYQRECYAALFDHFNGKRIAPAPEAFEDEPQGPEDAKLQLVNAARRTFGVRAAGQLWLRLGLPVVPAMIGAGSRDSMDQMASFLDAACEVTGHAADTTSAGDLAKAFQIYLRDIGAPELTVMTIYRRIAETAAAWPAEAGPGFSKRRSAAQNLYSGIRLTPEMRGRLHEAA